MKTKGEIEDLKFLKVFKKRRKRKEEKTDIKKKMIVKMVKISLGLSLVLLWAGWSQFIFGQFLGLAYISQDLQAPSYVVGTNDRVLIYCTCHFQGGSLCFRFSCLLVSSVSDFRPDMGGRTLFFFMLTCSVVLWGGRDAANKQHCRVHTVSQPRWACPCLWHTNHSGSTLLSRELSEPGPRLRAPPRSKPLRFGTQVALRGADSVGTAFCALPRSEQLRCVVSVVAATCRLSRLCCSVFWVYHWGPL